MDIILIALVVAGLCLFGWIFMTGLFALIRLADKAHPAAWLPLMGLVGIMPWILTPVIGA